MNRRGFLQACLALAAAPAIVRADSLMRVVPRDTVILPASDTFVALDLANADGILETTSGIWVVFCHPTLEPELRAMVPVEDFGKFGAHGVIGRVDGYDIWEQTTFTRPEPRKKILKARVYGPKGAELWRR